MMEEGKKLYPNCDANVWIRTCEEEVAQPLKGEIIGEIPSWVNGTLLRNGPGSIKVGSARFKHVFDGSALIHRFHIKDGGVTYQCRFVQTATRQKNRVANRIVCTEFGTEAVPDPCHSIFNRFASVFKIGAYLTDNTVISVYPFGDEVYTLTEAAVVHRIDPVTLETMERKDLMGSVVVNHTAHPHVMPNGDVYNLGMARSKGKLQYAIVKFPFSKKDMFETAHIVCTVPPRWAMHPAYMHSFGITDNYFVLVEQPFSLSLVSFLWNQVLNGTIASCLKWHPDHEVSKEYAKAASGCWRPLIALLNFELGCKLRLIKVAVGIPFCVASGLDIHKLSQNLSHHEYLTLKTREQIFMTHKYLSRPGTEINLKTCIVLVDRKTGVTKRYRTETLMFFHLINSYEKDDELIIDLCTYKDPKIIEAMYIHAIEAMQTNEEYATWCRSRPKRIEISLSAPEGTKVQTTLLADISCEQPRINYQKFNGLPYRYFYGCGTDTDTVHACPLIKIDVETGEKKLWYEAGWSPGEAVFLAHPDAKEEDEGVLLSAMVRECTPHSPRAHDLVLLVLDARSMRELGRARFRTPSPSPKCLHGWFLPEKTKP